MPAAALSHYVIILVVGMLLPLVPARARSAVPDISAKRIPSNPAGN